MNVIKELWHGNVCPQTDSRNNSFEMKELMEYMARHHDDLLKTMTDEHMKLLLRMAIREAKQSGSPL